MYCFSIVSTTNDSSNDVPSEDLSPWKARSCHLLIGVSAMDKAISVIRDVGGHRWNTEVALSVSNGFAIWACVNWAFGSKGRDPVGKVPVKVDAERSQVPEFGSGGNIFVETLSNAFGNEIDTEFC